MRGSYPDSPVTQDGLQRLLCQRRGWFAQCAECIHPRILQKRMLKEQRQTFSRHQIDTTSENASASDRERRWLIKPFFPLLTRWWARSLRFRFVLPSGLAPVCACVFCQVVAEALWVIAVYYFTAESSVELKPHKKAGRGWWRILQESSMCHVLSQ